MNTLLTRPAPVPLSVEASPPLLVDITELGRLLHRSKASLERDLAAGRLIAPVRIYGSRRWKYADVVAWVETGNCCDRRTWEALQAARKANGRK